MTAVVETGEFIDEAAIAQAMLSATTKDATRVREILAKAKELNGLSMDEVAVLSSVSDPELLAELFATARECKEAIYGQRLVLFAPLYISNLCNNDCLYCAFRVRNKELHRRVEPLLIFTVDGASFVDAEDARWEVVAAVLGEGAFAAPPP